VPALREGCVPRTASIWRSYRVGETREIARSVPVVEDDPLLDLDAIMAEMDGEDDDSEEATMFTIEVTVAW
jgi:hypothetical protein